MNKIVLYYHIYLTDDRGAWSTIFLEQMKFIEDFGLLNELEKIRATVVSIRDQRRVEFLNLCSTYNVNFEINFIDNPFNNDRLMSHNLDGEQTATENITYQKIWDDCQKQDQIVLYLHSKGITSYERFLKSGFPEGAQAFKRYYYWRQFLNWGAIENWRCMVSALNDYDVAGINYQRDPSPHYSGAFWWSKSDHIKTLPNPSTNQWWLDIKSGNKDPWFSQAPDRYKDEHWVTSKPNTTSFNLIENKDNPYYTLMTVNKYKK